MIDTLASRIAKASIEVGSLAADKTNKDQNYDYLSADLILQKAGAALSNNGVTIFPSITGTNIKTTERQGKSPRIDADVSFEMIISDGETERKMLWTGYGSDYMTPDKAIYKAITSGHKYFEMKLLNIGIGNEDGEHEVEDKPDANAKKPEVSAHDKLMKRWEELWKKAQDLGLKVEPLAPKLTDDEITSRGKELHAMIVEAEKKVTNVPEN